MLRSYFLCLAAIVWLLLPAAQGQTEGLPLKPERKIEFTTNEGTWMSVDIAPEGQTIIFDLLGDIYTLPLAGGLARPLMQGPAFDSQPRFSPDGKSIVFVSDRDGADNLWIAKADGTDLRRLSDERQARFISPVWAPKGKVVIVSLASPATRGLAELWAFSLNGDKPLPIPTGPAGAPSPLVSAPPAGAFGAHLTADGRFIYYAAVTPRQYRSTAGPRAEIVRYEMETRQESTVVSRAGEAFRPAVSPDGKWLVYASRRAGQTGLRLRELVTGEERWLKCPLGRDELEAKASRDILPNYSFTPDGQELLIAFNGKFHRLRLSDGADTVIPFTAKISLDAGPLLDFPQRLETGPVRARIAHQPALSPDGKRLAFSAFAELYLMDLPAGPPRRVTNTFEAREFQPTWSPDGQWLAFVTWTPAGGHIWKAPADGSGPPQKLTQTPAFYREPAWHPDGSSLVALRSTRLSRLEGNSAEDAEIITLPATGGASKLVAPAKASTRPHFGPDPQRIYFSRGYPGGLVSMRSDGTEFRVVSQTGSSGPLPPTAQINPEGTKALALIANQLYLFALPPASSDSKTPRLTPDAPDAQRLTTTGVDSFAWAENGKTITWAVGASFYRLPLAALTNQTAAETLLRVEKPRPTPGGSIVLRGAKAITMRGEEIIPRADMLITGNRIAALGPRGTFKIPADARVFDLSGKTIMPGLIDIHSHGSANRVLPDPDNYFFAANLAYGVTSIRDPQSLNNEIFLYRDLADAGLLLSPRLFSTGPGVFSDTNLQTLAEARRVVRRYREHYRTHLLKAYLVGNRRQRQILAQACREFQVMPTTEGYADLKMDLTHALDGFSGNEHALPVPIFNDVVQLYARSGITYTPTLQVAFGGPFAVYRFAAGEKPLENPKLRRFTPPDVLYSQTGERQLWFTEKDYHYPQIAAGAAKIMQAGGRIGLGGHGELQGLGSHWETWALASGMSNYEALRAATIMSAQAIGYGAELGSLEPGKMADLLVLDKDPMVNIRHTDTISYVMKDGHLFAGETLRQIWPRQKNAPPLWWNELEKKTQD